ncbi:MAG TPA: XrtA system polysaccharide chain length determinant [Candidatus Acidoferrales bacterium]
MAQRELTPADYLAMLKRHWIMILILTIVGGPLAYGVSRLLPVKYKSQTLVLIEQQSVPEKYVTSIDTSDISQRLSSMQQQILSRSRLEPIIRQYGLYSNDAQKTSMDVLVGRLQTAIEVTPVAPMAETRSRELPGFNVAVTWDNARTAQEVCTAVTSMFIEENLKSRQQHSEETTQFLSTQLVDAQAALNDQDAKLSAFKSRYMGALPDEEQTNLNLLTGLTSQLDAATQALYRAQQDKSFAETMLNQQVSAWQSSQTGHNPATLEQQLIALQNQLATLQSRYTEDYPDVVKTKADIAALQKKMAEDNQAGAMATTKEPKSSVEPASIQQLRAQVHSYDQAIAAKTKEQEQIKQQIGLYQSRIQSSPAVEQQYKEVTRGYETALASYNDLLKKRQEAAMASQMERDQQGEQFRVLDPANLPSKPSFPNRPLFALGGFGGGLGLGLGLALLLEMKDSSFKTERDVEVALQLPVLAMIPAVESLDSKKKLRPGHAPVETGVEVGAGA